MGNVSMFARINKVYMKGFDKIYVFLTVLLLGVSITLKAQTAGTAFSLPEVPDTLKTPSLRASYLVAHYWDNFIFMDSLQYLNAPESIEQAIVNYIDLFRLVCEDEADNSLKRMMHQAELTRSGLYFFYNAYEKYLYDVGSPVRNENRFIPVLQQMTASSKISSDEKIRPEMLLKSVLKNKVGSEAADFTYVMADKSRHRLQALESPVTFLLFFDPDCNECHQVIKQLESAEWLNDLIQQKKLTLLAVYPGENYSLWKTMQPNLPKTWIVGYDADCAIYKKELYDILGFPTMFLLDEQKKVLLKDTSPEKIEEYLSSFH